MFTARPAVRIPWNTTARTPLEFAARLDRTRSPQERGSITAPVPLGQRRERLCAGDEAARVLVPTVLVALLRAEREMRQVVLLRLDMQAKRMEGVLRGRPRPRRASPPAMT